MNVLFLNRPYKPDADKRRELELLQAEIHFIRVRLLADTKGLNVFQRKLSLQRFHNGWRERLCLVEEARVINE